MSFRTACGMTFIFEVLGFEMTSSKLMTTDKDFLHLDKAYFDLILIET